MSDAAPGIRRRRSGQGFGYRDAVGNPEYARDNKSYGLTTLRNRHVDFVRGGRARFRFRGKGGQEHDVVLDDTRLVRLLRHCQQLPGQALFQYRDDDGEVVPPSAAANANGKPPHSGSCAAPTRARRAEPCSAAPSRRA